MNQKYYRVLLILTIFLSTLTISVKVQAAGNNMLRGEGTREEPYLIESVEELVYFRDSVNAGNDYEGCYILQTKNLDLEQISNWEPIGVFDSENYFYGTYDGGGHWVSNLNIEREDNCGFFG